MNIEPIKKYWEQVNIVPDSYPRSLEVDTLFVLIGIYEFLEKSKENGEIK